VAASGPSSEESPPTFRQETEGGNSTEMEAATDHEMFQRLGGDRGGGGGGIIGNNRPGAGDLASLDLGVVVA
jgi:hypothetical protein